MIVAHLLLFIYCSFTFISFCWILHLQVILSTVSHLQYSCLERLFTSSLSSRQKTCIDCLYSKREKFYNGYCDDPRNTDNAWLEVVACNYHDDNYALSHSIDEVFVASMLLGLLTTEICSIFKWFIIRTVIIYLTIMFLLVLW